MWGNCSNGKDFCLGKTRPLRVIHNLLDDPYFLLCFSTIEMFMYNILFIVFSKADCRQRLYRFIQ